MVVVCLASHSCSDGSDHHDPLPAANQIVLIALNEAHDGDLGGLTGADALCLKQAKAANRNEKEWRAFLSTKSFDAKDVVPQASAETAEVVNGMGEHLIENWAALMTQSSWSTTAQLYSFDGKQLRPGTGADPDWTDGDGWHGSLPGGTRNPELHCRSWQTNSPQYQGANGEWDSRQLLKQEVHSCQSTFAVLCVGALVLPSYGTCTTPGSPCPTTDPCAVDPTCGSDKQCRPTRLTTCSDEFECTEDKCDGQGGCEFPIKSGYCKVGTKCYKDGEADESGCRVCDSSKDQTDLSLLPSACHLGSKCYKKGELDTSKCNVCDPSKGSTGGWVPRTDEHCKIGGQCQDKGDKHPAGCAVCDPSQTSVAWTPVGDVCLIDDKCHSAGSMDPTHCNECIPSQSKTAWLPTTKTVCKIAGKCYLPGSKHPQGCAECDPSVSVLVWTPKGNDCLIGNTCYPPAAKDPTGCNQCDPTVSKTTWTPITSNICKIDGKCYAPKAKHPQGCAECDPSYSTTTWKPVSNDCLIDGQCYPPGAKKPVGCGQCDPSLSKTSWSPLPGCWEIVLVALNEAHDGNLGGLSGADALCAAQAKAANLTGTFKAFLSGTTRNVKDLITGSPASFPVVNTKGEILFNTWSTVFTTTAWSSGKFIYSFDGKKVDENTGASPDWYDAQNWHGSLTGGTVKAGATCQDWTSNSTTYTGATGELDLYRLLYTYAQLCNKTLAVVCVKTAP
jgi:hypothetical protein